MKNAIKPAGKAVLRMSRYTCGIGDSVVFETGYKDGSVEIHCDYDGTMCPALRRGDAQPGQCPVRRAPARRKNYSL